MLIQRANIILYCNHWRDTANFYRDTFHFAVSHENEWFIEFQVMSSSYLSIADTRRATINSNHGDGITLTWQVEDVRAVHDRLTGQGITITPIKQKWGAWVCYLHDPEGHRIELWQPVD